MEGKRKAEAALQKIQAEQAKANKKVEAATNLDPNYAKPTDTKPTDTKPKEAKDKEAKDKDAKDEEAKDEEAKDKDAKPKKEKKRSIANKSVHQSENKSVNQSEKSMEQPEKPVEKPVKPKAKVYNKEPKNLDYINFSRRDDTNSFLKHMDEIEKHYTDTITPFQRQIIKDGYYRDKQLEREEKEEKVAAKKRPKKKATKPAEKEHSMVEPPETEGHVTHLAQNEYREHSEEQAPAVDSETRHKRAREERDKIKIPLEDLIKEGKELEAQKKNKKDK